MSGSSGIGPMISQADPDEVLGSPEQVQECQRGPSGPWSSPGAAESGPGASGSSPAQVHKAYCDQRRGQCEIIRNYYGVASSKDATQDMQGFIAFQHPAVRKLIQGEGKLTPQELDRLLGPVHGEPKGGDRRLRS